MEETANLLEKGENFVLKNIEKRLGNLENTMQEVLARGDQFNEETQKKLEAIQDEIKDILLNKILFIKEEIDENLLSGLVEEVSRKTYNRNFSLKPELLIHISLI